MNIQVYVAAHKASVQIPDENFVPIHVGKKGQRDSFCSIGDDTGNHISDRNDTFCELTAFYWVWKNTSKQDYVGFFHYRRHLNLSNEDTLETKWGVTEYHSIDDDYIKTNNLTSEALSVLLSEYDLILPAKWDVQKAGSRSMYDHFCNGESHGAKDYDLSLRILLNKYPEYKPFVDRVNKARLGYFTNIFIMKRDLFDDYCDWLFSILFELEKVLDISSYSVQERRIFGFISEWLFNIYIEKYIFDNPDVRIKHTQRTFIRETNPMPNPVPIDPQGIAIVMAFNDNFVPYAGVAIRSIAENSSSDNKYDIVIFDGHISDVNKKLLEFSIKDYEYINIRYINPSVAFGDLSLPTHLHISKDTYYRLLIPEIFSQYSRVVYIDGDMIVRTDIAELYSIDLNGKSVAAVTDHVMTGFRKFKTSSVPDKIEAETYLKNVLKMQNPAAYFQAGLIVFDVQKASAKLPLIKELLSSGKQFWFMDQDILNIAYQNDVCYLNTKWNVFHGNGNTKTFFTNLPAHSHDDYFRARMDPHIIHYAGEKKPWMVADIDFSEEFWTVARNTPWYESILSNMLNQYPRHVYGGAVRSSNVTYLKKIRKSLIVPVENWVRKQKRKFK